MGDAPARLRKAVSSGNVVPGRREGPGPRGLTLAGVLFELLLILLHCGHTAVVNQLAQALQVSHGLIYQLGIACYALQPGDGQTRGHFKDPCPLFFCPTRHHLVSRKLAPPHAFLYIPKSIITHSRQKPRHEEGWLIARVSL